MKSKTILVTGGTGYLGSLLSRRLIEEGFDVLIAKRSFSSLRRLEPIVGRLRFFDLDRAAPDAIFRQESIDIVLHCATDYGRKPIAPSAVIEANLVLPLKLLELSAEHGTKAFINTDTLLDKDVSHYSLSKKQFSDWLPKFSSRLVGINVGLEHFFGPGDDPTKFVPRMTSEIVREVERIDLTPGQQMRDFIYIDDVVEAFAVMIRKSSDLPRGYFRFEVGSGEKHSIRDFMMLLKRLAGNVRTELEFGAVPYREHEIMDVNIDLSALKALGWAPKVSLQDALMRMIDSTRLTISRS